MKKRMKWSSFKVRVKVKQRNDHILILRHRPTIQSPKKVAVNELCDDE